AMLDLLNVRYWMIPLEPRFLDKSSAPTGSLAFDITKNEIAIPPTLARSIQVSSFTELAANLLDGTVAGELVVRYADGGIDTFPLRLGIETADWDYERASAMGAIHHSRAPIAHSFPAFWRALGRPFDGHTYLARFDLKMAPVVGVRARSLLADARWVVESISLGEDGNGGTSLASQSGRNNLALAYMSDTVAAWENSDVMPRAFVVHTTQVLDDGAAFARLKNTDFHPNREAILSDGQPSSPAASPTRDTVEITDYESERVRLLVTTEQPGYLILADSWYPGWNAFVDGQPTPIQRADVLFRAVRIEPGTHSVVFEYQPASFVIGAAISIMSTLILAGVSVFHFGLRAKNLS
ncbi:MAG: YfhO family protein, partial [Chloroflexota bacterium]|nr:YfhO family protein [Chloroflexota bacterium]